jgi:transposase
VAKATRNAGPSRRLLALAEIYDGGSRTKAARIGGVGLQTLRDWGVTFNARGPEGLINGKAPGNACKLNDNQRQALAEMGECGPTPAIHGVVRWRLKDLTLWIGEEFRLSISETTLSRDLRGLGSRKLSTRPRHSAPNPEAWGAFPKASPPVERRSGRASRKAPRESWGGRTRRAGARRTRSRAAGRDGEPGPAPRTTRDRARPPSGRSALNRARARPSSCRDATRPR